MPHIVILYTPNLDAETDMSGLCSRLASTLLTVKDEEGKQVFPTGGVRVLRLQMVVLPDVLQGAQVTMDSFTSIYAWGVIEVMR